jgi:hypothetical protein
VSITTNVASSNPAQTRCTWYNIMLVIMWSTYIVQLRGVGASTQVFFHETNYANSSNYIAHVDIIKFIFYTESTIVVFHKWLADQREVNNKCWTGGMISV